MLISYQVGPSSVCPSVSAFISPSMTFLVNASPPKPLNEANVCVILTWGQGQSKGQIMYFLENSSPQVDVFISNFRGA